MTRHLHTGNAEAHIGMASRSRTVRARTIASWYHAPDGVTDAFTSTGIITDPRQLWDRLTHVSPTNRLSLYTAANERERFMLDCLAVYILTYGERGAVPGWSDKWVDKV